MFNGWLLCLFSLFLCFIENIEENTTEIFMKRMMTNSISMNELNNEINFQKEAKLTFF